MTCNIYTFKVSRHFGLSYSTPVRAGTQFFSPHFPQLSLSLFLFCLSLSLYSCLGLHFPLAFFNRTLGFLVSSHSLDTFRESTMSLRKGSKVWLEDRDLSWVPAEVADCKGKQVQVVAASGKKVKILVQVRDFV